VKPTILWTIIGLLAGACLFGFYESAHLLRQNMTLKETADNLGLKLASTEFSLKQTKEALDESYQKESELDDELNVAKSKLAKKDEQIQGYIQAIASLSGKLKESSQANIAFSKVYEEMKKQSVRLQFENLEMNKKLSSLQGLKTAIRDLKIKIRDEKSKKRSTVVPQKKVLVLKGIERSRDVQIEGNGGYFIKDGKSTYNTRIVNIRVVPAETVASF
jgi:chromosome segregation ATPase